MTNARGAGLAIRQMRLALGLSVRQLAHRADVSYPYLSRVERGLKDPSDRWVRDVNEALAAYATEVRGGAA